MKIFRILLGILAVIPLFMFADSLFLHPENYKVGSIGELLFPVIGLPILIINMWAWVEPEIIEFYFFGKEMENL